MFRSVDLTQWGSKPSVRMPTLRFNAVLTAGNSMGADSTDQGDSMCFQRFTPRLVEMKGWFRPRAALFQKSEQFSTFYELVPRKFERVIRSSKYELEDHTAFHVSGCAGARFTF